MTKTLRDGEAMLVMPSAKDSTEALFARKQCLGRLSRDAAN